ncbi:macrophage colony-stimulating factor 1 receptor 1 isoform X2 [Salminus brasiliensis]|uniref:macrophage colony-stimulating factor 1 receptor 1 isoform X2 n=1 Tax=Salminus brasiliensis TaxID=930266 RepID=UPI003B830980
MLTFTLLFVLLPFTAHAGLAVPVIRLNSTILNQSEVVLQSGTRFSLSCEGQAFSVVWRTRLTQHKKHVSKNVLTVRQSTADHTGTYRCSYRNRTDLFSEVHIYMRDSAQFFTKSLNPVIGQREGSACLLDCLPTDPSTTAFSLRLPDGSPVDPKINYTADPKHGIRIWNLQLNYSGEYVCSATVNNTQRLSTVFHLTVIQRVQRPPSVFTEMDEFVRIVGETLKISCFTSNIDHSYHITWHHSSKQVPSAETIMMNSSDVVRIRSVLTLPAVSVSDSGNLTCTAVNAVGENSSTVLLTVVEKPYVQLTPELKLSGRQSGADVELREGELLELRVNISAYPPILEVWWDTPKPQNTSTYKEIQKRYRAVANLSLIRIRADESGRYIFNARSASLNASTHFKVYVNQKPSVVVRWRNGTLTCIASGFPRPTVHWQQCEQLQAMDEGCNRNDSSRMKLQGRQHTLEPADEFRPQVVESVLLKREITHNGTVECVAGNVVGEGRDSFSTAGLYELHSTSEDLSSKVFLTLLSGAVAVSTLLLLLLGVCVYRCKQKPRYEIRWKIIEANDGNNYTYIDPNQLTYNTTKWEFPRDRLTFGQVLGAGAFGKVVEATAYGLDKDDHVTRVAVKMLKSSAHSEEKEALMSELKILSHLGPHANIVNLLGACTQGGPVLLITEYCSHGDLLNFLRRRADVFLNSVLQEHDLTNVYRNLSAHQSLKRFRSNSYQDMSGRRDQDGSQGCCRVGQENLWMLDLEDLLRFSSQVAQGLNFLASKNCIHRDVAARNVLVTDCFVVKICDFGLARDIMNDSNYVVRGNARLPVKWMSPESIFECIYTVQSDVWSYGILLWEIFSLGRSPYPDVVVDARFYKMIKAGYHMTQPDFAPPEIYTVMKMCWSLEPTSRPTFGKIVQLIAGLLPEIFDQYKNLQQELLSVSCVSPKACDAQHNQEEELLMQPNNYQLC